jgi:AcrR family transcriptional regulator
MPRIVDHQARRKELAEAVWRVMGQQGIEALTIRKVASEAHWSTGTLTHYFHDREQLVIYAFELSCQRAQENLDRYESAGLCLATLRQAICELLPLDEQKRAEAAIWTRFVSLASHHPAMEQARIELDQRWLQFLTRAIEAAQKRGEIASSLDARSEAEVLSLLLDGLSIQAARETTRLPASRQKEIINTQLSRLSAPAASPTSTGACDHT